MDVVVRWSLCAAALLRVTSVWSRSGVGSVGQRLNDHWQVDGLDGRGVQTLLPAPTVLSVLRYDSVCARVFSQGRVPVRCVCLRFFLSALPKWRCWTCLVCASGWRCLVSCLFVYVSDVCAGRFVLV